MATAAQKTISPTEENRLTSSKTGTLYFAYGSNLSPFQMRLRCSVRPEQSSVPVAITRLEGWEWFICESGYANVKPVPLGKREQSHVISEPDDLSERQYVYGVLYDMAPEDVTYLDGFEGCGPHQDPFPEDNPDPDPVKRRRKPHLQRNRDYNKLYLPVTVTKWLTDPTRLGITDSHAGNEIDVLVYVDENRLEEGEIVPSYIGRMNRAIRESVELGMPLEWMNKTMRKWVKMGIELKDHTFIGDDEGYKEDWVESRSGEVHVVLSSQPCQTEH